MTIHHLKQWQKSSSQRPIELFFYGAPHWQELPKPIVIIGGVHGDEPEGVALCTELIQWLQQNRNQNFNPWALIPCLNPDGIEKDSRVNGNGVDINRNYPASNWSAEHEKARYFPGTSPGSELETQAVVSLVQHTQPAAIIHTHSWKPCVVNTGSKATPIAKKLTNSSGYELVNEIGYPTPGSLSYYGWHDNKIPIICTEEIEGTSQAQTWKNFGPGLISILTDKDLYDEVTR